MTAEISSQNEGSPHGGHTLSGQLCGRGLPLSALLFFSMAFTKQLIRVIHPNERASPHFK